MPIITYTTAPESYDGFGTRTVKALAGRSNGKPVRKVETPDEHVEWQRTRYGSGGHSVISEEHWTELVGAGIVELVDGCDHQSIDLPEFDDDGRSLQFSYAARCPDCGETVWVKRL